MKLKIGILVKDINQLSNWKLRIVQDTINNPNIDLHLIVANANLKIKKGSNLFSRIFSAKHLLGLQISLEKRFFFKEIFSVEKNILKQKIYDNGIIEVNPVIQRNTYFFTTHDIDEIQNLKLDVIVNFDFKKTNRELLASSKHGVWELVPNDFSFNKRGPAGFWEVLHKQESMSISLVKHCPDRTSGILIDTAFFNREWSMVQTTRIAYEGAVSLLFKNFKNLVNDTLDITNKPVKPIQEYRYPSVVNVLHYIFKFNIQLGTKIFEKLGNTILGLRQEKWSLFLGKGSFLEADLSGYKPLKMPKDEFWADPFLFTYNNVDFLFFENYSYQTKRGKISCGIVKENNLIDIVDVLDLGYHLSYPYIFEENGDIFLMPETSANKRLEIYRAVEFPTKWELFTTAFEGELVADASFYTDEQNSKWLFINKQAAETAPLNSELFIYKVDSIKLNKLQSHAQNPVIIDARVARNGGELFTYKNKLYRPSQRNIDGIYGRALNINEIEKLTLEEYIEKTVSIHKPNFDKGLMAMHHLHQFKNRFVFDAAFKRK